MIDMTRSNLSTCSRGSPHTCHSHRGFAVIEVMMSLILIVIGTTLAFPSYRDMVHKRQLNQAAEPFSSSTDTRQAIPFTPRQPVAVSHSRITGNDGCIGTMEYRDLLL